MNKSGKQLSPISPGEAPLSVFISSVMSPELNPLRATVAEALHKFPFLSVWMFEDMPASSTNAVNLYLQHVREANFVVWLVGGKTTPAVQEEIQEAIAYNRRLLIFRLPGEEPDSITTSVLEAVSRTNPKWFPLKSLDDEHVREAVQQTISDEVVRQFRDISTIDRCKLLEHLDRESLVRCKNLWIAAGLDDAEAEEFSMERTIGTPPSNTYPSESQRMVVLIGEAGSGKSLTLERMFQTAIRRALDEAVPAIPVYLDATRLPDGLIEAVKSFCTGMGDPIVQGAAVFIDRVDEMHPTQVIRILQEARVICELYPNTTVVIASRPRIDFVDAVEAIPISVLSIDQAYSLIEHILGREFPRYIRRSALADEDLQRPLFAILYAVYLRDNTGIPFSTGELLTNLVKRALRSAQTDQNLEIVLQRLAQLYIDWGSKPIPISELGIEFSIDSLLATGLVVYQNHALTFPLPILSQWFAAQSLVAGNPNPEELATNLERLGRWRYALSIVMSNFNHDQVSTVFSPIVREHPAFASIVIEEGLAHWRMREDIALPPEEVCKERLIGTMEHWIKGIGPLADLLAPIRKDKTLLPLSAGIDEEQKFLFTSWGEDMEELGWERRREQLPLYNIYLSMSLKKAARPGKQSAWAWRRTFEDLSYNLKHLMNERELPVLDGPLMSEALWRDALILTNRRKLYIESIPLMEIETHLAGVIGGSYRSVNGVPIERIVQLLSWVQSLRSQGELDLVAPYPGPDLPTERGHWIWSPFSEKRILERTQIAFYNALQAYQWIVETWFPKFADGLEMYALLPVCVVGTVSSSTEYPGPTVSWYLDPLDRGEQSVVDFNLGRRSEKPDRRFFEDMRDKYTQLRPDKKRLPIYFHNTRVEISTFTPATDLAYEWLWDDLRNISWVEGMLQTKWR